MPRERLLWSLLALLVAAGLIGGFLARQEREVAIVLAPGLPEPVPAARASRVWEPFPAAPVASRPFGRIPLGRPAILAVEGTDGLRRGTSANGPKALPTLYVIDFADLRVKVLAPDLVLERTLAPPASAADGEGWETVQVMDLEVAGGRVWLADPQGGQVLALRPDGSLERRLEVPGGPFRLAVAGDGTVTVLVADAEGHLYERHPPSGGAAAEPRPFGTLVAAGHQIPYTVDGVLVPDGAGGIVHVLRNRSLIAAWDATGTLRYLVEPVAPHPPARLWRSGTGHLRGDPEAPVAALDAAARGDALYVLTTEDGTSAGPGVIDVYALADGRYRHSWRLPERWRNLAVSEEGMVALTGEAVKRYAFDPAQLRESIAR